MNSIQLPNLTLPNLSLDSLLWNLGLGIFLSFVLCWHYSLRSGKKSLRRDLGLVLPVICLTTLVVISVVKSSLALSLGLVGALSIVRFRTPIKEPEELAYIFLSIALGLALGADQREPAIVALPIILIVISAIDFFSKEKSINSGNIMLSLEVRNHENESNILEEILKVLTTASSKVNVRRIDQENGFICIVCLIDSVKKENLSNLSSTFLEKFPDGKFTLIDDHSFPNE